MKLNDMLGRLITEAGGLLEAGGPVDHVALVESTDEDRVLNQTEHWLIDRDGNAVGFMLQIEVGRRWAVELVLYEHPRENYMDDPDPLSEKLLN